jgi:hypothetical protein
MSISIVTEQVPTLAERVPRLLDGRVVLLFQQIKDEGVTASIHVNQR